MRRGIMSLTVMLLLAATALGAVAGESAALLLEKGVQAEETAGDLDAAIAAYRQVLANPKAMDQIAAEAQYRIGACYEKKGEKGLAAAAFQKVVSNYPEQKGFVEKARERVSETWHALMLVDDEVMATIYGAYIQCFAMAGAKGLPANAHVYGVDEQGGMCRGGFLVYSNRSGRVITDEVMLGNFNPRPDILLLNEQGTFQEYRFEELKASRSGRLFRLWWKPDRPMQPGEHRVLGYINNETTSLAGAGGEFHLTMQNTFGSPVVESFFLITPENLAIKEQSREPISRQPVAEFVIAHYQREVPANTKNVVKVVLGQELLSDATEKSEQTKKTEAALDRKIEGFSVQDRPLKDVMDYFRRYFDDELNVVFDQSVFHDDDVLITLTINNVRFSAALNLMLNPRGLDCAVWSEALYIGPAEKLRSLEPDGSGGPIYVSKKPRGKSEQTKKIEALLDRKIEGFSVQDRPLKDVMDYFRRYFDDELNVVFDPSLFHDDDVLITLTMDNVRFASVLNAMLRPRGLDYTVWNEVLYIGPAGNVKAIEDTGKYHRPSHGDEFGPGLQSF